MFSSIGVVMECCCLEEAEGLNINQVGVDSGHWKGT